MMDYNAIHLLWFASPLFLSLLTLQCSLIIPISSTLALLFKG